MPRFRFITTLVNSALNLVRDREADEQNENHSIASTLIEDRQFDFPPEALDDDENNGTDAASSSTVPIPKQAAATARCSCGFCAHSVSLIRTADEQRQSVPLPAIVQFRHGTRRVNVTLESADDMPQQLRRGGNKSAFRQVVITRSGTRFNHLSSAARAIFKVRSVNGFKCAFLNVTHSGEGGQQLSRAVSLAKLPRSYISSNVARAPDDPGVCVA